MTDAKLLTGLSRTHSKYSKKINRFNKVIDKQKLAIKDRNNELKKYRALVKHLLKENRITKKELSEYLTKRKDLPNE